jgi:hypothetical protein
MAFIVKKNPTQKFQYEKGMDTLSGKQFGKHMSHLHTAVENNSAAQKASGVSVNKA